MGCEATVFAFTLFSCSAGILLCGYVYDMVNKNVSQQKESKQVFNKRGDIGMLRFLMGLFIGNNQGSVDPANTLKDVKVYNDKLGAAKRNLDRAIACFSTIASDSSGEINHSKSIIESHEQRIAEFEKIREDADSIVDKFSNITV